MNSYHIVHDAQKDAWCVTKESEKLRCFANKMDAFNLGQSFAPRNGGGQLTIHAQDGSIENVLYYGQWVK
jgi:hypothetical protein